ncbi:MAG: hypothetical protein OEV73_02380 [Desulfobulbaceae bacterium]|nr:hypothetical protein [Desulfobulbaceae bacterium]
MSWQRYKNSGLLLATFALAGAGCLAKPVQVRPPAAAPQPVVAVAPAVSGRAAEPVAEPPALSPAPQPVPVSVAAGDGKGLGLEQVARRSAVYEGELSRWRTVTDRMMAEDVSGTKALPDGWYDCLQRVEALYDDYGRLQRRIVADGEREAVLQESWEVAEADFAFQESGCRVLLREQIEKPVAAKGSVSDAESRGRQVLEAVRTGRYQEALAAYAGIASGAAVDVRVRQAYAMALLRTNQVDAALAELLKIVAEYRDFDTWQLRRLVADLQLAGGKRKEAAKGYEALLAAFGAQQKEKEWAREQLALLAGADRRIGEMNSYAEALRAYLTFDGKRVPGELKMWVARLEYSYPGGSYAVKARQLLSRVEDEARAWVGDRLREVDGLVEARQYAQALTRLEDLADQDLPAEMIEVVRKSMDEVVVLSTQVQAEQRGHVEQILQERWREAERLLDAERFDEAITVFSSLFGTTVDVRAREKIGEAAALAAAKMRQEGASLFFRAGRTADIAQKKELLLQSREILQSILDKYPYVELVDKVAGNLQNVEAQLRLVAEGPSTNTDGSAKTGRPPVDGGDRLLW